MPLPATLQVIFKDSDPTERWVKFDANQQTIAVCDVSWVEYNLDGTWKRCGGIFKNKGWEQENRAGRPMMVQVSDWHPESMKMESEDTRSGTVRYGWSEAMQLRSRIDLKQTPAPAPAAEAPAPKPVVAEQQVAPVTQVPAPPAPRERRSAPTAEAQSANPAPAAPSTPGEPEVVRRRGRQRASGGATDAPAA